MLSPSPLLTPAALRNLHLDTLPDVHRLRPSHPSPEFLPVELLESSVTICLFLKAPYHDLRRTGAIKQVEPIFIDLARILGTETIPRSAASCFKQLTESL